MGSSAPTALAVRIAEAAGLTLVGIARDVIFAFGTFYIHRLLRAGSERSLVLPPAAAVPNRPMSLSVSITSHPPQITSARENSCTPSVKTDLPCLVSR